MGHKIRTQFGKTNISGDGNYITQIGQGNQNNSNNTTHNHYHGNNKTASSDSSEAIIFGGTILFLVAFMNYSLFKYANYVTTVITYAHLGLFLTLLAIYNLYKNQDLDIKDYLNILLILVIGTLSFSCTSDLFSMQEFKTLAEHAKDKTFLEYWNVKTEWKIISIYFLISSILISFLLFANICFTISFLRYSFGYCKQSNFIGMVIILIVAILSCYFIIFNPSILIKLISQIPIIK